VTIQSKKRMKNFALRALSVLLAIVIVGTTLISILAGL